MNETLAPEIQPRSLPGQDPQLELQLLTDALPVLVSYLELDGAELRYRFANKIYESWFAFAREQIIGRRLRDVIGEDAYRVVEPYVTRALAGERLTFEQFMPYENAQARHIRVEYVPRVSDGRVTGIYALIEDVTQAKAAEAALRESEEDFRFAAELNPQVAWTAQPDGQLDRVAARWREWTGTSGLGSSYADGLHPDDVQRTLEVWGRSVATGEPYDIVHRVRRLSGEYRWIRSRAYPRRDGQGRIIRWYGTTEDIDEQKTAEDHLRLMVLELNHRVKNNLATVQAIALQTLRGSDDTETARGAFLQRISALAWAHDILTRKHGEGADIAELAHGVLDPLTGGSRSVVIAGPPLKLPSQTALSLSMAFHELGTNALKYGALQSPAGRVELAWSMSADGQFTLTWTERDGPPVTAPTRRGFGTRLLERGIARELKGRVELSYPPEGFVCLIQARLTQVD